MPTTPSPDYRDNTKVVTRALGLIAAAAVLVGLVAGVIMTVRWSRCRKADKLAQASWEEVRAYKTREGLAPGSEAQPSLDRAVALAGQTVAVCRTPRAMGMYGLTQAYAARLNWGKEKVCQDAGSALSSVDQITQRAMDDPARSVETLFARAIWSFKQCQCASVWQEGRVDPACEDASMVFETAWNEVPADQGWDWFRFEVGWQWQMHELVLGHAYRDAGQADIAGELYGAALARCDEVAAYAHAAPINDGELYKNCMRAATAMEQWDDLSRYTVALATLDPAVGPRPSVGPIPALARASKFRDSSCNDIRVYETPRFRKKTYGFKGYPRPRGGRSEERFCVGWVYAQLGCVAQAEKELKSYVRRSSGTHVDEAQALLQELSAAGEVCLVPGI